MSSPNIKSELVRQITLLTEKTPSIETSWNGRLTRLTAIPERDNLAKRFCLTIRGEIDKLNKGEYTFIMDDSFTIANSFFVNSKTHSVSGSGKDLESDKPEELVVKEVLEQVAATMDPDDLEDFGGWTRKI